MIISSATLDANLFQPFFLDAPVLKLPGSRFRVEIRYPDAEHLEYMADQASSFVDLDLERKGRKEEQTKRWKQIITLVEAINNEEQQKPGDILVFLPGQEDIETLQEKLAKLRAQRGSARLQMVPCHASLAIEEQQRIFAETEPGTRKVVLATNIAESSITIDAITHVIDCGTFKVKWYCPHFFANLETNNPRPS